MGQEPMYDVFVNKHSVLKNNKTLSLRLVSIPDDQQTPGRQRISDPSIIFSALCVSVIQQLKGHLNLYSVNKSFEICSFKQLVLVYIFHGIHLYRKTCIFFYY